MPLKRYLATVSYDGSRYVGWQRQDNGLGIQQVIEECLFSILKENITIVASGRTDALVHAYDQKFHFDIMHYISPNNLVLALNSKLPDDIYIVSIIQVANDFHARFNCVKKTYEYHINNGIYNPMINNYSCYIKNKLDIDKMKQCSKLFIGEHDFTSFCQNSLATHPIQVRTIYDIDIKQTKDDYIVITYTGNGFLRYMVRMITAAIVHCGLNKLSLSDISNIINYKDKEAFKHNMCAKGLYLKKVEY